MEGLDSETAMNELMTGLKNEKKGYIYHCYNHYMCPIGFENTPQLPFDAYKKKEEIELFRNWIIIGEISKMYPVFHTINWDDIYQPSTTIRNTGADTRDFDSVHNVTESLQDHLIWQLNLTPMSPKDYLIGEIIIDSIDSRGMLTAPVEEIWAALDDEIELDEVLAVVHRIQQFDPPGVAATGLAECLLIQLKNF